MALLVSGDAAGQVTSRASVHTAGTEGNAASGYSPNGFTTLSLSADGRHVAFASYAGNLVPGDTNARLDVFVRDRWNGTTERVSVSTAGAQGNQVSDSPSISADGRFVVFMSEASNLVAGDTNGFWDVFVRDRQSAATERASVSSAGAQGNSRSFTPSISADGRFVAFMSGADNLVAGDANGEFDIFVRDRQSGTTELVSVDSAEAQGNGNSTMTSISSNGRFVAFASLATNLVASDTNGVYDTFVRDRLLGTTELVTVDSAGAQGNGDGYSPWISADGRYVAFSSISTNLVALDTNGTWDVFVRDRQLGTTERVSVDSSGMQAGGASSSGSISADGRTVAFASYASDLVAGDTNGMLDSFLRDRQNGTTERVSVDSSGQEANGLSGYFSAVISADGRFVAFDSDAMNLVAGDLNGWADVFVRDRSGTSFTSVCHPGVAGVIGCPCANPPASPGRGCDNSSSTGGALLSASGATYLSSDGLVFTTSGETPTALSIVFQGNVTAESGIVYGQGVRCAAGALERLYSKTASGGGLTAPDFGAGDEAVSARSAAQGDRIAAGSSRWYFVAYRDRVVLGGCGRASTFNASQGGRVAWYP